jgi:hypothetical protein
MFWHLGIQRGVSVEQKLNPQECMEVVSRIKYNQLVIRLLRFIFLKCDSLMDYAEIVNTLRN